MRKQGEMQSNTLGLRLKVFVKVSFFNVDAKRLLYEFSHGVPAGYHSRRRVHREKKKTLNPSVLRCNPRFVAIGLGILFQDQGYCILI
jgi:hypothetical protein